MKRLSDKQKEEMAIRRADLAYAKALKCRSPGCCTCPNMKRCPSCNYTEHDKMLLGDHRYCDAMMREETRR